MKKIKLVLSAVAAICALPLLSAVELATPFNDGMVLQRGMKVPVWGTAAPGETVTVTFAEQVKTAKADGKGGWRVDLDPMSATKTGREMIVSVGNSSSAKRSDGDVASPGAPSNRTILKDVLVGEVWMSAGQSNASCPIWSTEPHFRDGQGAAVVQMTVKPFVRLVKVPIRPATEPYLKGRATWVKMTPQALGWNPKARFPSGLGPSAMGYYYALELANALDIPIGIVDTSCSNTNIDAWTPPSGYGTVPSLADVAALPRLDEAAFAVARTNGAYRTARSPFLYGAMKQQPSVLWNGMVAAFAPMAVRGMLWYQGCNNAAEAARYCDKMHALYRGWSGEFANPDLRIYFVQLAPWCDPNFTALRLAQANFEMEEPNAAMAVVNDVGCLTEIHPNDKRTVARRLALHALRRDYGFDWIVDNSPTLKNVRLGDGKFVLEFNDVREWYLYNADWSVRNGFEIAGADGVWKPARIENLATWARDEAKSGGTIRGAALVVSSPDVPEPAALRYLWSSPWAGNLYNESGLPLGVFAVDAGIVRAMKALGASVTGCRIEAGKYAAIEFALSPEPESYIRCRLELPVPERWNGELWGQGNSSYGGGFAGLWRYRAEGSAAVETDLGTSKFVTGEATKDWSLAAHRDYADRATHLMTLCAKRAVRAYYGRPQEHAFFFGGSCGGRQGFSEAMRHPEDYDGILSYTPAAAATVSSAQAFNVYRRTHDAEGRELVTPEQLAALADAAIEFRKDRDEKPFAGHVLANPFWSEDEIDGFVAFVAKRIPAFASADMRGRVKGILMGDVDSSGRRTCGGMLPGVSHGNPLGMNFRVPKLCSCNYRVTLSNGTTVVRNDNVFSPYPSWDEFEAKAVAHCGEINASATDLAPFARRGGKLLVSCGLEDQTTPAPETVAWYEMLAESHGGFEKTKDFCRLFPLPGVSHGGGGGRILRGGADDVHRDLLRQWVKKGVAPETYPLEWKQRGLVIPVPPYPERAYQDASGAWCRTRYPENAVRRPDKRFFETTLPSAAATDLPRDLFETRFRERLPAVEPPPVAFALDASVADDGVRVTVKDGRATVVAGRLRNLVFGAGRLLKAIRWRKGGYDLADGEYGATPAKRFRAAYLARHFRNYYMEVGGPEIARYIEDLALDGINAFAFQAMMPVVDVAHETPETVRRYDAVTRRMTDAIKALDCDFCEPAGGNQLPTDSPEAFRAVPVKMRSNLGFNACPSKPEALAAMLSMREKKFAARGESRQDAFVYWPYDEGGCDCEKCRPWGANGYVRLCEKLRDFYASKCPKAKHIVSAWCFDQADYEGFWKYLGTQDWIDYVLCDAHTDFPRYPLEHPLPGRAKLVTFPEISMWGRFPWGGLGAIMMPARFERLFRQVEKIAGGFYYYSEGLFEDVNKTVVTDLYVSPESTAEESLRRYARYHFAGTDPEDFVRLAKLLEADHLGTEITRPRAAEARRIAEKMNGEILPTLRDAWRWRLVYIRAVCDDLMVSAPGFEPVWIAPHEDRAKPEALRPYIEELVRRYHAERQDAAVREGRSHGWTCPRMHGGEE